MAEKKCVTLFFTDMNVIWCIMSTSIFFFRYCRINERVSELEKIHLDVCTLWMCVLEILKTIFTNAPSVTIYFVSICFHILNPSSILYDFWSSEWWQTRRQNSKTLIKHMKLLSSELVWQSSTEANNKRSTEETNNQV